MKVRGRGIKQSLIKRRENREERKKRETPDTSYLKIKRKEKRRRGE